METRKKTERAEQALLAFGLLILGGYTGWNQRLEYVRLQDRERMRLADQARIIADNLGWQLGAVNHTLAMLQQDLPGVLAHPDGLRLLDQRLESLDGSMPGVRTLFVQDRAGTTIASNRAGILGRNAQGRAYFQLARRVNDPSVLHVSAPIQNALGTFAIDLERSLVDPQGRFAGLVAVTLDPAYFSTLLSSVNYAADVRTSLIHADGTLFLTVPVQVIPAGNALDVPGSLFRRHMASGLATTVLTGRISGGGGEWRVMAHTTVRPAGIPMDVPLVIAVSRDREALLAPWWRDFKDEARLFGLLALTSVSGLLTLQNRKRGLDAVRRRSEAALRENQRALEALNQSLEARVQEAVGELRAKDQILITQNRQAALGEMIGNIAHQWRQPLNTLSMILINLKDAFRFQDLDPERLDQSLAKGHDLIQKMSTTINDFMDFSRPEKSGSAFSALEQVRSTVALVDIAFEAQGISIVIDAARDVALYGLPNEFSQVLLNLLSNARQAIRDAGLADGRVTMAVGEQDGFGCLRVSDNGGGIPEPFLDRIFEPYFSTRETGTGIGLYMSRQIIEQSMKGRLLVRNVGAGAEFTVLVPLAEARPAVP